MVPTALGFGAVQTRAAADYLPEDSAVEACGFWCSVAAGLVAIFIYDAIDSYPEGPYGGGGAGGWPENPPTGGGGGW